MPSATKRTEITVTVRRTNICTGRTEIWEAASTDGTWSYVRTEEPGTPWVVTHEPSGTWEYAASLPKARSYTADESWVAWMLAQHAAEAAAR